MNIIEYVKLASDTNYVPVKYVVMDSLVGSAVGSSYLWLKCISYGMDTKVNFDQYVSDIDTGAISSSIMPTGIQGTLHSYQIVTLANIESYFSKQNNHAGPFNIG